MAKRVFKTKKRVSGVRATYRPWKEWDENDIVVGKFLAQKEDDYGNPSWIIEIEEAMLKDKKLSKSLVGQNLCLNSAGQLNKAMEQVSVGEIVQVEYMGTSTIEKGKYKGKESHLMEVNVMVEEGEDAEEELDEEVEEDSDYDDL